MRPVERRAANSALMKRIFTHKVHEFAWFAFQSGSTVKEEEEKMRSKLKEKGQNVPLAATYAQVLELYDYIVEKDMMSMFRSDVAKIQYPLLPSSALNLVSKDIQVLLKTKGSDLGRALRDPSLSPKHVCGLVHLMGEMVRMDGDYTASHVRREQPVHKNTPDVLIRFAANARVHSGLHILKRSEWIQKIRIYEMRRC